MTHEDRCRELLRGLGFLIPTETQMELVRAFALMIEEEAAAAAMRPAEGMVTGACEATAAVNDMAGREWMSRMGPPPTEGMAADASEVAFLAAKQADAKAELAQLKESGMWDTVAAWYSEPAAQDSVPSPSGSAEAAAAVNAEAKVDLAALTWEVPKAITPKCVISEEGTLSLGASASSVTGRAELPPWLVEAQEQQHRAWPALRGEMAAWRVARDASEAHAPRLAGLVEDLRRERKRLGTENINTFGVWAELSPEGMPVVCLGLTEEPETLSLQEARGLVTYLQSAITDAEEAYLAAEPRNAHEAEVRAACRAVWRGRRAEKS